MTSARRGLARARGGWFLAGALCLLGCHAQRPAETPSAVLIYERQPELLIHEIERIRGMSDQRPTRIVFDDETAFASALAGKVKGDAIGPSDADSPAFSLAFEFPGPNAQKGSSWAEVYDEQLLGFFDEHTHAVHVRKALIDQKSELEVAAVLAHELTHSLQIQHFTVPDLAALTDEDSRLAQNAVLEGDAMLVMVSYLAYRNRIPLNRALVRAASAASDREFDRYNRARGGQRALQNAPPLLRERMSFPYLQGMTFVSALFRAGGFELVNKIYSKPPVTSEQVLHPQKYLSGELAVPVRAPEPPRGYKVVASGRVGELQISAILSYCIAPERAAEAAAGWGGDAYAVAVDSAQHGALLWATSWDDEREAKQFEDSLREYVECTRARAGTNVMPEDDTIRREGKAVALVRGIGRAAAGPMLAGLIAGAAVAPRAVPPFGAIAIPAVKQAKPYRAPYLSSGYYVNEELGVVTLVPPGLSPEIGGAATATFSRKQPSPVVMGIELSDQLASMQTVDEVHAVLAREFQRVIGNMQLTYLNGRDVQISTLGRGIERVWRVSGTSAGLKAIVLPMCAGTGSLVLWGVWADDQGLNTLDWWLGSVKPTLPGEAPVCAELNP
ncbi:MAG TPA: hypothetical protein VGP93_18610, partial [Polyangiaceae bacterium]|nr:hypothetical protein [Polyangiaceae bacterium]